MNRQLTLLACAMAMVALTPLSGCGKPAAEVSKEAPRQAPAVTSRIVKVTLLDLTPRLTLDGEVANLYSPDIAAEVNGKVLSAHVEPGQTVAKGDLLFKIDASDAMLTAAADRAEQARLGALASDKAAQVSRLSPLAEKDLVSKASVTTARNDAAAAAEAVKAATARSALSARSVSKGEVRAPFNAEVVERRAAPGAYVRAGDVMVSLVSTEASFVRVFVPEADAPLLQVGMKADVSVAGAAPFSSTVTALNRRANKNSRTVEATVSVPAGQSVRPGSSARISLALQAHKALTVAETAVVTEGDTAFVYVVDAGVAKKTAVKLGARAAGNVEITEGLAEGVATAQDAAFLYDGARVANGAEK